MCFTRTGTCFCVFTKTTWRGHVSVRLLSSLQLPGRRLLCVSSVLLWGHCLPHPGSVCLPHEHGATQTQPVAKPKAVAAGALGQSVWALCAPFISLLCLCGSKHGCGHQM